MISLDFLALDTLALAAANMAADVHLLASENSGEFRSC
jgi:hypothetical protein